MVFLLFNAFLRNPQIISFSKFSNAFVFYIFILIILTKWSINHNHVSSLVIALTIMDIGVSTLLPIKLILIGTFGLMSYVFLFPNPNLPTFLFFYLLSFTFLCWITTNTISNTSYATWAESLFPNPFIFFTFLSCPQFLCRVAWDCLIFLVSYSN